jgi:hypothetical protein
VKLWNNGVQTTSQLILGLCLNESKPCKKG